MFKRPILKFIEKFTNNKEFIIMTNEQIEKKPIDVLNDIVNGIKNLESKNLIGKFGASFTEPGSYENLINMFILSIVCSKYVIYYNVQDKPIFKNYRTKLLEYLETPDFVIIYKESFKLNKPVTLKENHYIKNEQISVKECLKYLKKYDSFNVLHGCSSSASTSEFSHFTFHEEKDLFTGWKKIGNKLAKPKSYPNYITAVYAMPIAFHFYLVIGIWANIKRIFLYKNENENMQISTFTKFCKDNKVNLVLTRYISVFMFHETEYNGIVLVDYGALCDSDGPIARRMIEQNCWINSFSSSDDGVILMSIINKKNKDDYGKFNYVMPKFKVWLTKEGNLVVYNKYTKQTKITKDLFKKEGKNLIFIGRKEPMREDSIKKNTTI